MDGELTWPYGQKDCIHLIEGIAKRVLQREILRLQGGIVTFQLLQTGAHDVQDGTLDGPHERRQ